MADAAPKPLSALFVENSEPDADRMLRATRHAMATVLIVDDEPSLRRLASRFLTPSFNVKCLEAPDGAVALGHLRSTPVDVVLLDLDMPVMDGLKTLETIRQTPALRAMPVVLLTGRPAELRIKAAMDLGLATVLLKPFSEEALCARVRPLLAAHVRTQGIERRQAKRLSLHENQSLLIIERDADSRHLLLSTLGHVLRVGSVENEFVAMSTCAASSPDIVWLGETSGVWSREQLKRAIGELPNRRPVVYVASLPKDELVSAAASGLYAAVIRRTSDLAELEAEFLRVCDTTTGAHILLRPESPSIQALLAAVGELGLAIVPAPASTPDIVGRQAVASVVFNVAGVKVVMTLAVPLFGAIELAGQGPRRGPDVIGHERALAFLKSISATWAQLALASVAMRGMVAELEVATAQWVNEGTSVSDSLYRTSRSFLTGERTPVIATITTHLSH